MKKNIILIGMPGVGKSTVGVVLAKVMGYQFIDADLVIQEKEGKLLREIIAEVGPEGFLKVENRINSGIEVPLYEKYADVIVDEHHLNVEQTIEKIMELKERFQ